MSPLILIAAADPGGQVQQIATTFGVDWPHLIAQIISFCIVCFLLQRYAYRPVLHILDQRRQQIAQDVVNREKIKSELAQAEAERRRIILQAEEKATKVIEEAHGAAADVLKQETQKAISASEQIIAKAHEAALLERERMLRELKREIGTLVIEATASVTRKTLSADDQRRMAEETINSLARAA